MTKNEEGKTRLQPTRIAQAYRHLVLAEGHDPNAIATLELARKNQNKFVSAAFPFETISWVTFLMMLSELGKKKELNDLLEFADTKLSPTWENGGLFYPRNDTLVDEEGDFVHMEAHSGNSGIAYARLNVPDGQKIIWEKPWTRETLQDRPWVDGMGYADGVDFLRGEWDAEKNAVVVTMRSWDGKQKRANLVLRNLAEGEWAVYIDGKLKDQKHAKVGGSIAVEVTLGAKEVDVVVVAVETSDDGVWLGQPIGSQPETMARL